MLLYHQLATMQIPHKHLIMKTDVMLHGIQTIEFVNTLLLLLLSTPSLYTSEVET